MAGCLQSIQTVLQFWHVGFQLVNYLLPHLSLQRPRFLTANDGGGFPIDAMFCQCSLGQVSL
jgi:hypothetical protein